MDATMQHHPLRISDLFEHGERIHAGATVTDYEDGVLVHRTFAEVADESRRLATALAALGVGRGDVVATLCWNSSHHIAAYFAVPGMGAVLHTLNLRLHSSQLSYIAQHAEDQAVLVDADLLPLLLEFLTEVPSVRHVVCTGELDLGSLNVEGVTFHRYVDLIAAAEPTTELVEVQEDEAAVLCYTTGTTGDPKGVAYSHRSTYLHTLMISTGSAYGFTDADTALPVVPMFHANAWVMTETSPLLTYSRPPAGTSPDEMIGWTTRTGRVMPGVRARIVDEQGVVQPWDGLSQGEVEVAGNTITGAYFGNADSTKFRDGWLRTGDLGVIDPGGWVQLKDRLKDGIKSGGEWISSVELENAIAEHPAVAEVAVIGVPDPKWEERPMVCVRLREGAEAGPAELSEFLSERYRVAKWWIPDRWTFTSTIPRTSVGKPDKNALRASTN